MLPIAAVRTGGQVQTLMAGDRALWLSVAEQMARRGAALSVSTGYSLDVRDVRRVCSGGVFCCWRTVTARMRCRPLTIWVTGRC